MNVIDNVKNDDVEDSKVEEPIESEKVETKHVEEVSKAREKRGQSCANF
ncbi:hypothetical protein HCQ94_02400 [Actinomyces sp. zg-332]|nr:hypothetical protein [Actinomyces sp. zg-332]QPK94569.1 hypothetical protein HCQ94_02400 [Actinomyces sp. zg-332]